MNFKNLGKAYKQFAAILLNTFFLFLLINLIAWYFLNKKRGSRTGKIFPKKEIIYPSQLRSDLSNPDNLLLKVYPGHDKQSILQIFKQSQQVDHPILTLSPKPGNYFHYQIGKERVRYDSKVHENNIDSVLSHSIWLFGGSTMYGHCMAKEETIGAHLNKIDKDNYYLNFGISGANQHIEINKLLILLKKGYRPAKVIFLDGNNDLLGNVFMNFHPAETPGRNTLAYPLRTNLNNFNRPKSPNLIRKSPIVKAFSSKKQKDNSYTPLQLPYERLDDSLSLYYQDPNKHFNANRRLPCSEMNFYPQRIFDTYKDE